MKAVKHITMILMTAAMFTSCALDSHLKLTKPEEKTDTKTATKAKPASILRFARVHR